jgi:hypothetical protein
MEQYVFDIETDGLRDQVTKIHCLSYMNCRTQELKTIFDYKDIEDFFKQNAVFIGHSIIRYDIPVVQDVLGIDLSEIKKIDTLGLSWYLHPYRSNHGLKSWSKQTGVAKPVVEDWKEAGISVYQDRCEHDVKNNYVIYTWFKYYLEQLYDNNYNKIVNYINFKLDCLREQEEYGIPLNIEKAEKVKEELTSILQEKTDVLSKAMPNNLGRVIKTRPKVLFKKNGQFSVYGLNWVKETSKRGLNYNQVEVIREEPNPGSHDQLKEWLIGLGWEPQTYKATITEPKNKKAFQRAVADAKEKVEKGLAKDLKIEGDKVIKDLAQISLPFGAGICPSVKELTDKEPAIEALDDYYKIVHRLGIIDGKNGYLKAVQNGKVISTAHGFTNTMRLTHSSPIVNLPKPGTFYGEEVRSCLYVDNPDEYIMCGSDISSLEGSTQDHYISFYDPKYVEEKRKPGFDSHTDIAVLSGMMTQEEEKFFKWYSSKV